MKNYKKGQKIGVNNLVFVKEEDSIVKPLSKNSKYNYKERMVVVICPFCSKEFSTRLRNLTRKDSSVQSCQECAKKIRMEKFSSCGAESALDLVGTRFGKLVVLDKTNKRKKRSVVWHCQCDCGNECEVSSVDLQRGHKLSCGCIKSKGELRISDLLTDMNIEYETEKIFTNCRNPKTNQQLRFDFYLPDYNCCIEYDGEQHFKYSNKGWNTQNNFEQTKYRDLIKENFCKTNNIHLIRIPYTEYDNLNTSYLQKLLFK